MDLLLCVLGARGSVGEVQSTLRTDGKCEGESGRMGFMISFKNEFFTMEQPIMIFKVDFAHICE